MHYVKKLGSHVDSALLRLQLTDFVASFQSMSKSLAEEYEGVSEVVGVNENENENKNESYFESGTKCYKEKLRIHYTAFQY